MKITSSLRVDGREIYVVDDAFSPEGIEAIDRRMRRGPYARSQNSRKDTADYRHFATTLDRPQIMETFLGDALREAIKTCFPGERFVAYRFYSNMRLFADSAYPHRDVTPPQKHITILLYANKEWDPDWGGETLFYDDEGECVMGAVPKPGRLVLFRGAIIHRAGLVNRECYEPRYTVALKFAKLPAKRAKASARATRRSAPRAGKGRRAIARAAR